MQCCLESEGFLVLCGVRIGAWIGGALWARAVVFFAACHAVGIEFSSVNRAVPVPGTPLTYCKLVKLLHVYKVFLLLMYTPVTSLEDR